MCNTTEMPFPRIRVIQTGRKRQVGQRLRIAILGKELAATVIILIAIEGLKCQRVREALDSLFKIIVEVQNAAGDPRNKVLGVLCQLGFHLF